MLVTVIKLLLWPLVKGDGRLMARSSDGVQYLGIFISLLCFRIFHMVADHGRIVDAVEVADEKRTRPGDRLTTVRR